MSEFKAEGLNPAQRDMLQYLVLGNGAMVFDAEMMVVCEQLQEMGLVTFSINGKWGSTSVDPTEAGRKILAPAQPASASGDGDDVVDNLRAQLAAAVSALADMRKLALSVAAPLHQDIVDFEREADEDTDYMEWFVGRADSELFYRSAYQAYKVYNQVSTQQQAAAPSAGEAE